MIFYVLIFLSVYVQVFFFITFLENRKKIVVRNGKINLKFYPSVTIAVPCFNEAETIYDTVQSLLNLNYPQDKLKIVIVDDGSTDGTWEAISAFKNHPNIEILRKENGGKHTALNLVLERTTTDFFSCLDADSFAHPEALARIMSYFERDSEVMAVVPSVLVSSPKKIIQNAQRAEYQMGIYVKKMFSFLGAINVAPGPLTVFRKKVFDDLGHYRHAHHTEDMEIAYRMQKNHYKIEHCNDAYVYTNTPTTVRKLYKQRLRWIYGFINNTIDYKSVLFRKKYGHFSFFTLPMGIISIVSVSYLFSRIVYNFATFLYSKLFFFKVVGFNFPDKIFNFDLFFFNLESLTFLVVALYVSIIFAMVFGRKMSEGKWGLSLDMLYFIPIFSFIAPFWLISAVWSTIIRRRPEWR